MSTGRLLIGSSSSPMFNCCRLFRDSSSSPMSTGRLLIGSSSSPMFNCGRLLRGSGSSLMFTCGSFF